MISNEAIRYFNAEDLDEIQDIYEEKLFEFKQFFLSKLPVEKLFRTKINQVIQLQKMADEVITNHAIEVLTINNTPFDGSQLRVFYLDYQAQKNQLKQKIAIAQHANNLLPFVEQLLNLEISYAQQWYNENASEEGILVSKEPDPMELLKSITLFEANGGKSVEDVKNNHFQPSEILLNEMKRLSLLYKKYA